MAKFLRAFQTPFGSTCIGPLCELAVARLAMTHQPFREFSLGPERLGVQLFGHASVCRSSASCFSLLLAYRSKFEERHRATLALRRIALRNPWLLQWNPLAQRNNRLA